MSIPLVATYRLQLRDGVGFDEARAMLPYLKALGISHLYLSPIFKASHGSTHGYDCVDPREIDPALGGADGFEGLTDALARLEMGLLLDIVPNHLGIGAENPFWQAMLRDGLTSEAARFFDVDWQASAGGVPGKILLPFLGRPLREVLASGELERIDDPLPVIRYHEHIFPLAPGTEELPLEEAIGRQHWRLAWWRCGNSLLNWRRFFDITGLAGVRVEDDAVFDTTHVTLLRLIKQGQVQGLRIDHIDGLAEPRAYLERLHRAWRDVTPTRPWVLVEKILGEDEDLPRDWEVDGTTGYELLNAILGLFIDADGLDMLDATYGAFGGDPDAFLEILGEAKRRILETSLKAEFDRLTACLLSQPEADLPRQDLEAVLRETILAFPYYRTYGTMGFGAADRARLDAALQTARVRSNADPATVEFLSHYIKTGSPALRYFEQLTGPAMAKAMEDTAFYRWFRLIAANEVGGEPHHCTISPERLHDVFSKRADRWPTALVASATHDTKRGEDTRIRIACLSQMAEIWDEEVRELARLAEPFRPVDGPGLEAVYFLFQTLVGVWPSQGERDDDFTQRITAYLVKAAREAKRETSWTDQNAAYEEALTGFATQCLADPDLGHRIDAFCEKLAPKAAALSLGQTVIKLTCPGVPDIYRGTERLDQSLVDPDNRRPLDVETLARIPASMPADWRDGRLKQFIIKQVLQARGAMPSLFTHGRYAPLHFDGPESDRLFGFRREEGDRAALTIVQHRQADLDRPTSWQGHILLPDHLRDRSWHDVIQDRAVAGGGTLALENLTFPATVLIAS